MIYIALLEQLMIRLTVSLLLASVTAACASMVRCSRAARPSRRSPCSCQVFVFAFKARVASLLVHYPLCFVIKLVTGNC